MDEDNQADVSRSSDSSLPSKENDVSNESFRVQFNLLLEFETGFYLKELQLNEADLNNLKNMSLKEVCLALFDRHSFINEKTGDLVTYTKSKLRCSFEQENEFYVVPDEDLDRDFLDTVRSFKIRYPNKNEFEIYATLDNYPTSSKLGMCVFVLVALLLLVWLSLYTFYY